MNICEHLGTSGNIWEHLGTSWSIKEIDRNTQSCMSDGMGWMGSLKHSHTRAPLCGANKIWFRHLSSWHLSKPVVGPGICPPGICPKQNMVQAFVRNKCRSWHLSSWHLSKTKYGSGICPKQNMVQAFVLLAFVQTNSWSKIGILEHKKGNILF